MRLALGVAGLLFGLVMAMGCAQDRYHMKPVEKDEPILPPDEKRFNEPPAAGYKKPPPPKDEKSLIGRPMGMGPGMGGGGFGP